MIRRLLAAALAATAAAVAVRRWPGSSTCTAVRPTPRGARAWPIGFEKATGIKVAVVQKATGEMLAQVKAEKANPKGDVWWAGPADAYLQAAEEGLLETYASPNLVQLHDWARRITEVSQNRVSGVYGGILALGYNTELQAKKKLPVPEVLEGPARSRVQERGDARQPEFLRHRVPDAGVARAGLRRGRGVQVHEGAECQRELVRALGHRPDDRGQAGRDLRRQHRAPRRDQRDRRRLSR